MAKLPNDSVRKLPSWVLLLGSAVLGFHLFSLVILALAAPSGPWPVFYGVDMSTGPQFANSIGDITTNHYLRPLGMTHNYHFLSNRTAQSGVWFEVILKDKNGKETKRLKFPEEKANFWVHHRQLLLAQGLDSDQPIQRGAEKVASTKQKVQKVDYWLTVEETKKLIAKGVLKDYWLQNVPEDFVPDVAHFVRISIPEDQDGVIPRERPLARPSPWALTLAKSYMRHLCEKYDAHSAELIRHTRPAVLPAYMFMITAPNDAFMETIAHFGDLQRDFEEVSR